MTESVCFEADSDRFLEFSTLAVKLGVSEQDLLNEAMETLLAAYRDRQCGQEPIGLLAALNGIQRRIRIMVDELRTIRFMTCTADSMLSELGIAKDGVERLSR